VTYDQVLAHFPGARRLADGKAAARCPAHDDSTASLSISLGTDGRTVMHCHAGCDTAEVLSAVGLTARDLFAAERPVSASAGKRTCYDYLDESGRLLYQAVRIATADGKTFRQRRPDGKGGWAWNLQGVRRVLYHLPELLAASPERIIYIAEGEKDVDNLRAVGELATTNPQGAGKWHKDYSEFLRGRRVVVLPDNDPPGAAHGAQVAQSLHGVAASVKVVLLPGLPRKGDVSDWFAAGHTVEELRAIVEAAPEWTATQSAPTETITADAIVPPGQYGFSESEAARRFGDILRGRAVFAADAGVWYYHDGQRFVRDHRHGWMLGESLRVSHGYADDAARDPRDPHYQDRLDVAKRYNGLAGRKRLIELAEANTEGLRVMVAQFDCDPWLLNCLNGTIDLHTGQLRPHSAADLLTKMAPVNYDPAAKCPRWEQFLIEVLPDAETIAFVQLFVGFCLSAGPSPKGEGFPVSTVSRLKASPPSRPSTPSP
jgi:hypothetical protein